MYKAACQDASGPFSDLAEFKRCRCVIGSHGMMRTAVTKKLSKVQLQAPKKRGESVTSVSTTVAARPQKVPLAMNEKWCIFVTAFGVV